MHQPVELAVRLIELAVEQGKAFNQEPHMRRRGIDPTDAVLFQHAGQRQPANPLSRARGRQAPPQVERPRRRDVVVNRGEELWIVAPELLPHLIRQAHAFPRQLLAQPRPLP